MYAEELECTKCGRTYLLGNYCKCSSCGGILQVVYRWPKGRPFTEDEGMQGIWRYMDRLPVKEKANMVSLGEGSTPLISSVRLSRETGVESIFFKMESANPSGSFKDRGIAVSVSKARELGADTLIVASTGNASASTAAYAARAGMRCVVCVPETTSVAKVSQAMAHGATVVLAEGDFSNAYALALEASEHFGWVNTSTTYLNPYNLEGNKTVAYELLSQLRGSVPDAVVVPVGAGPLLAGIARGFEELKGQGRIHRLPRLVGVQARACSPIFRAFEEKSEAVESWKTSFTTLAKGVGDPLTGYEDDGVMTLRSILASGGSVEALEEEEIRSAAVSLAEKEGIYAEPTASIAAGALSGLKKKGRICTDETVVCLVTGHGLKDFIQGGSRPRTVSSLEDLERAVEGSRRG